MKQLRNIFLRGLITFIPIALTVYILYSVINSVENLLGGFLRRIMGPENYIPGLGFFLTLGLIFIFGLLLNNFITGSFLKNLERQVTSVPFIKAIYSPLRDLMNLFSKEDKGNSPQKVVLVDLGPDTGPKLGSMGGKALGLVTRESFADIEALGSFTGTHVSVYFPMSYGLGGFTFLIPKEKIHQVDIPIEKAMSLAITGWVKSEREL